jgi:hypothetical protein
MHDWIKQHEVSITLASDDIVEVDAVTEDAALRIAGGFDMLLVCSRRLVQSGGFQSKSVPKNFFEKNTPGAVTLDPH